MSAAIDALRRTHALLEEAIRRMDAFDTDSALDDADAATVLESLRTAIDTVESIAGRVVLRPPPESIGSELVALRGGSEVAEVEDCSEDADSASNVGCPGKPNATHCGHWWRNQGSCCQCGADLVAVLP